MTRNGKWMVAALCVALFASSRAGAQEDLEDRVQKLEQENQELRRRIDVVAEEQERFELGDLVPPVGEGAHGLGPAASKVYGVEQGLSVGGYGEALFQGFAGSSEANTADFLRAVLYVGYRFDENWVFNSEIEFEHASTEDEGAVSVELAYLDYLWRPELNARVGLVLLPMGFLNELHEPTAYLAATRSETERRILPSTWREVGVGAFGDAGPISYRAYVVNGLDATGFDAGGLRGGRQDGSEALAEDVAFVARADWTDTPGLLAGGSFYVGDAGQGQPGLGNTRTTIAEVHAEWKGHGLWTRGLYSMAFVDDVARLNAANGFVGDESVGEELAGWYVEAGYDLLTLLAPDSRASVSPFVRYEAIDTQRDVPGGFASDPANDLDVLTIGVAIQPFSSIVFKLDYEDFSDGPDRFNALVGYVF